MQSALPQLHAPLGFTRADHVSPDEERPGLLRARTLPLGALPDDTFDFRSCALHDCTDSNAIEPGLEAAGFETVDLSGHPDLQRTLATVLAEDRISDRTAEALRGCLTGARLRLANGRHLRIEHVADEGLIQRRAGPNGLDTHAGPCFQK